MMFDPTKHDFDDAIRRSMDAFERARIGEVAATEPRFPKKVLLVVDGSSQDQMGQVVASGLCRRFGCSLEVIDAREREKEDDLAGSMADLLGATAIRIRTGDSHEQILAAIPDSQPDLVIVPCPFGRDLERIGADSTGTVIDVLLARAPVPLLVIRNVYPLEEHIFQRVLIVLTGENEAAPAASRWATGLTAPDGRLELQLVLTRETFENVRELMRSMESEVEVTADQLTQALKRSHIRLHRALQLSAEKQGFRYRLDVRREHSEHTVPGEAGGGKQHRLLVLASEKADLTSQGHVRDQIRRSSDCVLVVAQE